MAREVFFSSRALRGVQLGTVRRLTITTRIPEAQLRNAFTTPVLIVPPVPGYFQVPYINYHRREAGTAYNLGGGTQAQITTGDGLNNTDTVTLAGWLDQTEEKTTMTYFSGTGTASVAKTASYQTGLAFRLVTANLTGGSGDVVITVIYEQFPIGF